MQWSFDNFREQGEIILALREQVIQGRLPHALLITGAAGFGKKTLTDVIAAMLLCRKADSHPCGACRDCLLFENGEHPDVIRILAGQPLAPDGKKGRATIPVDDIREMIRLCSVRPLSGGQRVVQILEAEKMTPQAQNALLKTLEEPPEQTFFLLTASQTSGLLTTIISRCAQFRMKPWSDQMLLRTLRERGCPEERCMAAVALAGGSVGEAIRFAEDDESWQCFQEIQNDFFCIDKRSDVLTRSGAWKDKKEEGPFLFSCLEYLVLSMLHLRLNVGSGSGFRTLPGWEGFVLHAGLDRFSFLLDQISLARRQMQANVSFQALIEQLLFILIGEREAWQK